MTPSPKSSISFSMASERPSILATPSPISRTVPTFCLVTPVFSPEIWASMSCNNVLMCLNYSLQTFLQRLQASLDGAVVNVASHLDPHPAQQGRILRERKTQTRPVVSGQIRLHL